MIYHNAVYIMVGCISSLVQFCSIILGKNVLSLSINVELVLVINCPWKQNTSKLVLSFECMFAHIFGMLVTRYLHQFVEIKHNT